MNTQPVKMTYDPQPRFGVPGAITRHETPEGLVHLYVCPCGCEQLCSAKHQVVSGSVEEGNLTLSPSLWNNWPGGCGWHGFLTEGVFRHV